MTARKTIAVEKVVETANFYLSLDTIPDQQKKGIISLLNKILHETNQYNGFGYIDSYDAEDPEFNIDGRKDLRRFYYMKKK